MLGFIIGVIGFVNFIIFVYGAICLIKWKRNAKNNVEYALQYKAKFKKLLKIFLVLLVVNIILSSFNGFKGADNSTDSHKSSKQIKEEKQQDEQRKQKQEEQKKAKEAKNKAKTKEENTNLDKLKEQFINIPKETKNVITKVEFTQYGSVNITLSDDTLGLNDSQLKNVARSSVNNVKKVIESYNPLPEEYESADMGITVLDSSGNQIYQSQN